MTKQSKMCTQAVRLHESVIELVENLAELQDKKPSDVHREALAAHMTRSALEDPLFADCMKKVREKNMAEKLKDLHESIGTDISPETLQEVAESYGLNTVRFMELFGVDPPDEPDMGVTADLPEPINPQGGSAILGLPR